VLFLRLKCAPCSHDLNAFLAPINFAAAIKRGFTGWAAQRHGVAP